ncbi:MAG: SDR family oxidoreductase [Tropicimonas sp.]|uniref:SDR family oxidoreductase n=1 Tax=Tropicimonas sp. TaxID=2067044 RepID=UPI003A8C27D3
MGRGIALRLARDGLALTLFDLPGNRAAAEAVCGEIVDAGGTCRVSAGDVSRPADVDSGVAGHVAAYGGIDVMVANAGIAVTTHFVDTTVEDLDRTMAVNVRGVFNCYKAASRQMIEQGRGGRLIAAGSVSAHKGGEWQCAYVASKFVVRGFNQTVALELAQYGITANIYSPGATHTAMYDGIDTVVAKTLGTAPGSELKKVAAEIPLGRLATPADIANVVSFLASEDSAYVTGQSIIVSGGSCFA